ncbi:hypothetical protein [Acetobacterium bakii]|nr:hypothetical protein [Acetobacterium bakii]
MIFTLLGLLVKIMLIILLVIIVILLLILIIPFNYRISAVLKEKANIYLHLNWAFFEVELWLEDLKPFVKVRIFKRVLINEPLKKSLRKKPKPVKKTRKSNFKMPGMTFFKEILNFAKEVLNVLKPKKISAFGTYGLDDPVNTALVSFLIQLFSELVPHAHIGLDPVFDSEMTDVEINISGKIRLAVLVYIFIKYLLKREVRQVVFRKRINTET